MLHEIEIAVKNFDANFYQNTEGYVFRNWYSGETLYADTIIDMFDIMRINGFI